MAQWNAGDVSEVINRYASMVYRLAINRTKNKPDAEDVFQDVFLRFVKQKNSFESDEHMKAWLIRVTINCSKNHLNSSWFRRTTPFVDNISFETEEKTNVYYEILKLPLKYRTVIHLFYYEDLPTSKISSILSVNESTVKSQLLRARQMLKVSLKGEFD